MQPRRDNRILAVFLSLALHVLLVAIAGNFQFRSTGKPDTRERQERLLVLKVLPSPPKEILPEPAYQTPAPALQPAPAAVPATEALPVDPVATPVTDRQPASMAAPPAPTAEEWALAGKYTLKNSKRYRYTWGQQVRSMMGTAVEGPDQGMVRLRVEIAPDGTLARLDTLWSTSVVAEQLARKAIGNMPPLPPTPTGEPLIFERTISFSPFASDGPPIYKDDCLPDPPAYGNPFAWDGKSPQRRAAPAPVEKPDPRALEECLRQLPQDSIEAESAHDQRLMDRWGSGRLGR